MRVPRESTRMAKFSTGLLVLLVNISMAVFFLGGVGALMEGTMRGAPPKPSVFFAFGDSYADTGNQNHNSSCWKYPDGITWPGYPTGRFGDGHVQTDFLADKLGLPSPTPYVDMATKSIATGVNFAIGGSGVTFALGVLPLNTQVDNFELVLQSGAYSPSLLADSVTLVSNVGNDYGFKYTEMEFLVVVEDVIEGMTIALRRLYNLGLRNILVANLPPINCLPGTTIVSNYTTCEESIVPLILVHNNLLQEAVEELNTLAHANFLIVDELSTFTYLLDNSELYGIKEKLVSCCRPFTEADNCGDMDAQGNPRYTLCNDPTSHVFWDTVHPVESTWKHVVDLYYDQTGFLVGGLGATTLQSWLYQNSLRSFVPTAAPAPAPGSDIRQAGASSELEGAYHALISEPDYAESLGLLQAVNWNKYLGEISAQTVTVFLPNNIAYYSIPSSTIEHIYGQDEVVPVVNYHVVKGYYNSSILLSGSVQNLTTISGVDLLVTPTSNTFLVGLMNATIVRPDLYKIAGQVVVHGIDKILIPPGLIVN